MIFLFVPVAENSPSLPSTLHLQKILKYQKTRTMSKCSAFARDHLSSTIYYEYITAVSLSVVYISSQSVKINRECLHVLLVRLICCSRMHVIILRSVLYSILVKDALKKNLDDVAMFCFCETSAV
jgi:hypothetical protein